MDQSSSGELPNGGFAQFVEAHGVRVTPARLLFDQFETKEVYSLSMNILNIATNRKAVRYYAPVGKEFKLKGKTLEDVVSSGISLPISLEFRPTDLSMKRDRVVITVDGEKIEIPVECNPCRPVLEVSPIIDFGVLCSNNKMVTSHLIISNSGSKNGSFEISFDSSLPVNVNPLYGKVLPNSRTKVKVELIAKQQIPRIDSKIMVKLEGISQPVPVKLSGSIVEGRLELLTTDEEQQMTAVQMGAAYFGTDRAICAVLYNNSPEPTDFVVILQEGAPGQEAGNDVAGSAEGVLMKARRRYDGTAVDIMNIVSTIPNQGRLQPFQKIPFVIRFSPNWKYAPIGFQCSSEVPPRQDYALYLVVARVGTDLATSPDIDVALSSLGHVDSRLEVPICASALAPQLDLKPGPEINFGNCLVSDQFQIPLQVRNMCQELPAAIVFPKIAHFRCHPDRLRLAPGQEVTVAVRFEPRHFGSFNQQQAVEILGEVFDKTDPFLIICDVIHRQFLKLIGTSNATTTKPKPKFNPGITPLIKNEVGINADVKWAEAPEAGILRNSIVSSGTLTKKKKKVTLSRKSVNIEALIDSDYLDTSHYADSPKIAFPNDRQHSVGPFDRKENFLSIFTRISRYNYVDPDYAMTDVEMGEVAAHRRFYRRYIDDIKALRRQIARDKRGNRFEGPPNIGIEPACGIHPKRLTLMDIEKEAERQKSEDAASKYTWAPLSSKQLAQMALEAAGKPPVETLVPAPLTALQRAECARRLTPRELHQVTIDPGSVEFGEVSVRSTVRRELSILNNLDQHVSFKLKIDCPELRQSSPIQVVVPQRSRAVIPLCFEGDQLGRFQRSLEYFINEIHPGHITVTADVVPVELQLSTQHLILTPTPGLSPEAGIRGVITLVNKRNRCAEFQWHPVLQDGVIAFSIRPAVGKVEPFQDLDCEVVFHASFFAPADAQFICHVKDGPRLNFSCSAKLGQASCELIEKRILFGAVPLHLVTTKKAIIYNGGPHHAYFWVEEPNPLPGLTITPNYGVVPVGGTAELQVTVQPTGQMKFDTKTLISIRDHPTLDLRIGGSSEPSSVDIDISSFKFAGGVPLGTSATLPFVVSNKSTVRSQIVFDMTRYRDFSIRTKPDRIIPEENTFSSLNPGKFMLILSANENVECTLVFIPTEIASYDFVIPVTVNETMCRLPLPTPLPRTPIAASRRPSSVAVEHILTPKPVPVRLTTPCRRVTATAIRQTLKLSSTTMEFILPVGYEQKRREFMIEERKVLTITNVGPIKLKWRMDLAAIPDTGIIKFFRDSGVPFLTLGNSTTNFIEDELQSQQSQDILIMFSPVAAGEWRYDVPIYLNEQERPCQSLHVYGCVRQPHLSFDPEALIMPPVPLMTRAESKLSILCYDYVNPTAITVDVPTVECESGGQISPVTVVFPDGNIVKPAHVDSEDGFNEPHLLTMIVLFQCDRPISFSAKLVFHDTEGRRFTLPISATADNSLTTNYAFLAANQEGAKIVCEQGMRLKGTKSASTETVNMGEAIIVRTGSGRSLQDAVDQRPQRSGASSGIGDFGTVGGRMRPPSTVATTPSAFDVTMSSYEPSNDSSSNLSRDGAVNRNLPSLPSEGSHSKRPDTIMSRTFGSLLFPEEDSEQGVFHNDVLLAIQRWFSLFAYPIKPYPIKIPATLRIGCGRVEGIVWGGNLRGGGNGSGGNLSVNSAAASLKKDYQTVYQMIENLCGRPIPGMPADMPLPANLVERVKQLHWQHTTLLTFLKSQGAAVSGIRPEFLLEPNEFRAFLDIAQRQGHPLAPALGSWGNGRTREERDVEEELFEALSKQSWMNVLLQIVKTLVLSRVTPRTLKMQPKPDRSLNIPSINPDPIASNLYGVSERVLLTWLNFYYEQYRRKLWENSKRGGVPPSRWVVNFDLDLIDGLVLAAVVGAFVPFLVDEYLAQMYTYPATPEQCLHNALKLISALRAIGLEFDIQAIEITDPNPVSLMLLVYELYQKLPFYLPKETVEFRGLMHAMATRQISLVNNSDKPVIYQALLVGRNSADFHLPNGSIIAIGPKSQSTVTVSFTPRFLEPEEAVLVAVGRRQRSNTGTTMVFNLRGFVDNIKPAEVFRVETPCYELASMEICVRNISTNAGGQFFVRLIETHGSNPPDGSLGSDLFKAIKRHQKLKKKKQDRVPKNVKSKIDHGQTSRKVRTEDLMRGVRRASAAGSASSDRSDREDFDMAPPEQPAKKSLNQLLSAFYCPDTYISLEPGGQSVMTLYFLPFSIGSYYCSVVLSNPEIGDIVYAVNATSTLPLPDDLSNLEAPGFIGRALSATPSGENVLEARACQWLASPGQELRGFINVPLVNPARERALVTAGQLRLSPTEYKRRTATNTLESATIAANALITLLGDKVSSSELNELLSSTTPVSFHVDRTDAEHFIIPDDVSVPGNPFGTRSMPSHLDLPVTFVSASPGVYSCDILLASSTDYRLLRLSVSVTPPGQQADIIFRSSVNKVVNQQIPIANPTNFPWTLFASVIGDGFTGPMMLEVPALQLVNYPLTFHPTKPGECIGQLKLKSDDPSVNVEFDFTLQGVGEDPPAKDTIVIDCQANQMIEHTITVTNPTPRKLTFKVSCDIDCVVGPSLLSILPGHSRPYTFSCRPLCRGVIRGALVFEARSDVLLPTYDSDGDEIPDPYAHEAVEYDGFRVWFDMKIRVSPPLPVQHLDITACCLQSSVLEIAIRNPTTEPLKLSALVEGDHHLSGASSIEVEPLQTSVYEVIYRPRRVGHSRGTVTLFSPICGEFWYDLSLTSVTPPPIQLPSMTCQLGRWTSQTITLENPISEPIAFTARLNNTLNFRLDLDPTKPLIVKPKKTVDVSLTFTPSALGIGEAGQSATVTFSCQQFGDLVYQVVGGGQLPEVQEPVLLISEVGAAATVNIPWRNPFDIAVSLDISLIDLDEEKSRIYGKIHTATKDTASKLAAAGIVPASADQSRLNAGSTGSMIVADGAFRVLSRPITGAFVLQRGAHSITVAFTPVVRRVHEATLVVKVRRADGQTWKIPPNSVTNGQGGELADLSWLYPLNGLPDLGESDWRRATVVRGVVGVPLSSRLEAALSGVATGRGQPATINLWLEADRSDSLALTEGSLSADEFSFNMLYPDPGSTAILSRLVSLKLVNQLQDRLTGLVVLRFQIEFTAENTFSHRAELLIHSSSGGMWKFPLTIAAEYPPPVEVISLPTLSGGQESTAMVVLSNTTVNDSVPFSVRFEPQDPSFSVHPETGLLGPCDAKSQSEVRLTVRFRPACYGRTRHSRLVARIGTNKCIVYDVEGLGPQYEPPRGSVKVESWNPIYENPSQTPMKRLRVNYILQNMKLLTTGVCSPVKGGKLCRKNGKSKEKKQTSSSSLPLLSDSQT